MSFCSQGGGFGLPLRPPIRRETETPLVLISSGGHPSGQYASYWNAFLLPPANEVWGKVIFSVACVKNSVHGGVCLSACWDATPPLEQTRPWSRHPLTSHPLDQEQTPPQSRLPQDQAPPCAVHAGRCGQQAGSMHPTGMHSCFKIHLHFSKENFFFDFYWCSIWTLNWIRYEPIWKLCRF